MKNLELWNKVCKTDPSMTKQANVGGNKITAIKPQYQIKLATEQFGSYGKTWGFKSVELDYSLLSHDIVIFKGLFFFPEGQFEILNSIKLFKDNAKTKIDDDFAKKIETDALTKALSKLGFNADIFLGMYDDMRYVDSLNQEKSQEQAKVNESAKNEKLIIAILGLEDQLEATDGYTYKPKGRDALSKLTYEQLVTLGKELKEILATLKG